MKPTSHPAFTLLILLHIVFAGTATAAPSSLTQLEFAVSYLAGTNDAGGNFMGGTELINMVAHQEKIFAGNGYWKDVPGSDPSPGPQILSLASSQGTWKVEKSFGISYQRMTAMAEVTFTTDGGGNALIPPVTMLIASPSSITSSEMHVFTRDDATGVWTKTVVGTDTSDPSVRSLIVHRDAQTGIDNLFAGAGGNVFRGYYDAAAPGRISWQAAPEFQSPLQKRIMAMEEANGSLHVLTKPYWYRRTDGSPAAWTQVFSYPYPSPSTSSGMRGLTAIPNPGGTGQVLLAGLESNTGYLTRVDPQASYQEVRELDFPTYMSAALGTGCNVVVPSYNQMTPVTHPDTGEAVHLIGMQATNPNDRAATYYFVRHASGTYDLGRVPVEPTLAVGRTANVKRLVAVREILVSPFPEDKGRVFFFGGHDANNVDKHNTAWIYRALLPGLVNVKVLGIPASGPLQGQCQLECSGVPPQGFILEASSDLAAWLPLATLDLVQPALIYSDALAPGFTRRFYRTRLP